MSSRNASLAMAARSVLAIVLVAQLFGAACEACSARHAKRDAWLTPPCMDVAHPRMTAARELALVQRWFARIRQV